MNELIKQLQDEKRRIYSNRQIPIDELQLLVFSTYCVSQISEGKACEMLCIDRITFREMFANWLDEHNNMIEVMDVAINKIGVDYE